MNYEYSESELIQTDEKNRLWKTFFYDSREFRHEPYEPEPTFWRSTEFKGVLQSY